MSSVTLRSEACTGATVLDNTFIDNYMPQANGEFVKVFIYLLRVLSDNGVFSLDKAADRLQCTEGDIMRALKYWSRQDLLSLEMSSDKQLCGITLRSLPSKQETIVSEEVIVSDSPDAKSEKHSLTMERVRDLKQNEEIVQLLYITEQYLGKTLSPTEIEKILYFYDGLGMSADLIEYLIEYCVGKNHKSLRYIEKVAYSWHRDGITTVADAKKSVSGYSKEYFTILRYMGITNRSPVEDEVKIMDTWINTYGFTMEIIQEACSRTVLKTGQASFQYADRILESWKKKEVHDLDDIKSLDSEHQSGRQKSQNSKSCRSSAAPNRFNNFQQRKYDFDEYEKKLLKK